MDNAFLSLIFSEFVLLAIIKICIKRYSNILYCFTKYALYIFICIITIKIQTYNTQQDLKHDYVLIFQFLESFFSKTKFCMKNFHIFNISQGIIPFSIILRIHLENVI